MKKTVITITLLFTIFIVIAGNIFIKFSLANPNPRPAGPNITITYSPEFSTDSILLEIYMSVYSDTNNCTREAWYSLDEQANISIPLVFKGMINVGGYPFSEVTGQTKMPMWSQGPHTIKVSAKYTYEDFVLAESKILYIGQPEPVQLPPELIVISPQNQTNYNSSEVSVTYYIGSKIIWSYYALDTISEPTSADWKFFDGNITLTNLSEGSHKLVISVKTEGNPPSVPVSEKTIFFNVDNHTAIPFVPDLSLLVIASIGIAAIISAVLLFYFKKRKHQSITSISNNN